MANDIEKEVLAAEEGRCAAIAADDWDALDRIVADDFFYTHSTGTTQTKAEWIEMMHGRRKAVEHEGLVVRPLSDDVALLSGGSVYRYAEPFQGDSHYGSVLDVLQVWVRRDGEWKILAQHGVKNAEKN